MTQHRARVRAPGPGSRSSTAAPGDHALLSLMRAGASLFLLLHNATATPQSFSNYRKPMLKLPTLLPQYEALLL